MNPELVKTSKTQFPLVLDPNQDKYLSMSNVFIPMEYDENSGEYLDSKLWKMLEIDRKTDMRGRIHIGEKYFGTDVRVFVSDIDQEPETCKHYILLSASIYTEVRKTRIKEQAGELMKVQNSGDIWLGSSNKDKHVKVFVRK